MPPRNNIGLTFSQAHDIEALIQVRCNFCRSLRYYAPRDMLALLGDIEIDRLRRRLRCEGCDHRSYVHIEIARLFPQEKVGLVVRRLVMVRTIRRPVWRDEPL
jgi:hypothetical protein